MQNLKMMGKLANGGQNFYPPYNAQGYPHCYTGEGNPQFYPQSGNFQYNPHHSNPQYFPYGGNAQYHPNGVNPQYHPAGGNPEATNRRQQQGAKKEEITVNIVGQDQLQEQQRGRQHSQQRNVKSGIKVITRIFKCIDCCSDFEMEDVPGYGKEDDGEAEISNVPYALG